VMTREYNESMKGLLQRDTGGDLTLTDRGRAVLRAILPDL